MLHIALVAVGLFKNASKEYNPEHWDNTLVNKVV